MNNKTTARCADAAGISRRVRSRPGRKRAVLSVVAAVCLVALSRPLLAQEPAVNRLADEARPSLRPVVAETDNPVARSLLRAQRPLISEVPRPSPAAPPLRPVEPERREAVALPAAVPARLAPAAIANRNPYSNPLRPAETEQERPIGPAALDAARPGDAAKAQAGRLIAFDTLAEPELTLDLKLRSSKITKTKKPVLRISITNPKVLEVTQLTPTLLELAGLSVGQTNLTFCFAGPDGKSDGETLRYLVRVLPDQAAEEQRNPEGVARRQKMNEPSPNSVADYGGESNCDRRSTVGPVLQGRMLEVRNAAKRKARYQCMEDAYVQGPHGFSR